MENIEQEKLQNEKKKNDFAVKFGGRLKMLLAENKKNNCGISSRMRLAEELDVSMPSVSAYISGVKMPSYDKLIKISELFGVPTDWLLGLTDECDSHSVAQTFTAYDVAKYMLSLEASDYKLDVATLHFEYEPLNEFFNNYKSYVAAVKTAGENEQIAEMFNAWLEQEMQKLKK